MIHTPGFIQGTEHCSKPKNKIHLGSNSITKFKVHFIFEEMEKNKIMEKKQFNFFFYGQFGKLKDRHRFSSAYEISSQIPGFFKESRASGNPENALGLFQNK